MVEKYISQMNEQFEQEQYLSSTKKELREHRYETARQLDERIDHNQKALRQIRGECNRLLYRPFDGIKLTKEEKGYIKNIKVQLNQDLESLHRLEKQAKRIAKGKAPDDAQSVIDFQKKMLEVERRIVGMRKDINKILTHQPFGQPSYEATFHDINDIKKFTNNTEDINDFLEAQDEELLGASLNSQERRELHNIRQFLKYTINNKTGPMYYVPLDQNIWDRCCQSYPFLQKYRRPVSGQLSNYPSYCSTGCALPTYSNTQEAFAKGGVIGVLDYLGQQTNMTPGQRNFWKGAANIGVVVGGIYLGYKAISNIFGLFGTEEEKKKALSTIGIIAGTTLASQMALGKDPRKLVKELVNGGETSQKLMNLIDNPDATPSQNETVNYPSKVFFLLGNIPWSDVQANNLLIYDGDKIRVNYENMKSYITTTPRLTKDQKQYALMELEKFKNDPEFILDKGLRTLGVTPADIQNPANGEKTLSDYYTEYVKKLWSNADKKQERDGVDRLNLRPKLDQISGLTDKQKQELLAEAYKLNYETSVPIEFLVQEGQLVLSSYGHQTIINTNTLQITSKTPANSQPFPVRFLSLTELVQAAHNENSIKYKFVGRSTSSYKPFNINMLTRKLEFETHKPSLTQIPVMDETVEDTTLIFFGGFTGTLSTYKEQYKDYLNTLGIRHINGQYHNGDNSYQPENQDIFDQYTPEQQIDQTLKYLNQVSNQPVSIEKKDGTIWTLNVGGEKIMMDIDKKTIMSPRYDFITHQATREMVSMPVALGSYQELTNMAYFTANVIKQCAYSSSAVREDGQYFSRNKLTNNLQFDSKQGDIFPDLYFKKDKIADTGYLSSFDLFAPTLYPAIGNTEKFDQYVKRLNDMAIWRKQSSGIDQPPEGPVLSESETKQQLYTALRLLDQKYGGSVAIGKEITKKSDGIYEIYYKNMPVTIDTRPGKQGFSYYLPLIDRFVSFTLPGASMQELLFLLGENQTTIEIYRGKSTKKGDSYELFSFGKNPLTKNMLFFDEGGLVEKMVWDIKNKELYPTLLTQENKNRYTCMLNNLAIRKQPHQGPPLNDEE